MLDTRTQIEMGLSAINDKANAEAERHLAEVKYFTETIEFLSKRFWKEVYDIDPGQVLTVVNLNGKREQVEVLDYTFDRNFKNFPARKEDKQFALKVHPLTNDYKKAKNRTPYIVTIGRITTLHD